MPKTPAPKTLADKLRESLPRVVQSLLENIEPSQEIQELHGQRTYVAQDRNEAGRYDRQHDRYSVVPLGDVPRSQYRNITTELFRHMREQDEAVVGEIEKIRQAARKRKDIIKHGATCTTLLYDPHSFSLEIGSVGDSPAYLVLSDAKDHYAAVRIARAGQVYDAQDKAYTFDYTGHALPDRLAYSFASVPPHELQPKDTPDGSFALQPIIDEAVAHFQMDKGTTRASLLLASDGIEKLSFPGMANSPFIAREIAVGLDKADPNPAQRLISKVMESGGGDNQTAIVIADIKPGKGKPVAACVSDGMDADGYIHAHNAVRTFETVIAHYRDLAKQAVVQR